MKAQSIKDKFKSFSPFKKALVVLFASIASLFVVLILWVAITVWIPIASYKLTGKPEWVPDQLIIEGVNYCSDHNPTSND